MTNSTTNPCKSLNKTMPGLSLTVGAINRLVRKVEIVAIAFTPAWM
jgi:hypothetical protein